MVNQHRLCQLELEVRKKDIGNGISRPLWEKSYIRLERKKWSFSSNISFSIDLSIVRPLLYTIRYHLDVL